VHEAYLHLVDAEIPWQDRAHFLATAARQMRRILVDHARARRSAKRGGSLMLVPLDEAAASSQETPASILDLDEALTRLSEQDARKGRVIELHFFAGMTYEEIAEVIGVSAATVRLDVRIAKAWLRSELSREEGRGG
jgi:RNA polymerase sigma factor (TIGR02999 family)